MKRIYTGVKAIPCALEIVRVWQQTSSIMVLAPLTSSFPVAWFRSTAAAWTQQIQAAGITVKIFPTPSANDTISWQENTTGKLILCYRGGALYLNRLSQWQPHADRTDQSTFAGTTQTGSFIPTASYTLRFENLPMDLQKPWLGQTNEIAVLTLHQLWFKLVNLQISPPLGLSVAI